MKRPSGFPFTSSFLASGNSVLDQLVHSIEEMDINGVNSALTAGANPNAPIQMIGAYGMFSFPSPLCRDLTPMRYACVYGEYKPVNRAIFKALVKAGGTPGSCLHIESGLSTYCELGHYEMVEQFLVWGANSDGIEFCGVKTPLIKVLEGKHYTIADLLIKHGADVNYVPPDHRFNGKLITRAVSALLHFSYSGGTDQVRFLLKNKANSKSSTSRVGSALGTACERQNAGIITDLLAAGADPYAKTHNGKSAYALLKSSINQNNTQMKDIVDLIDTKYPVKAATSKKKKVAP